MAVMQSIMLMFSDTIVNWSKSNGQIFNAF